MRRTILIFCLTLAASLLLQPLKSQQQVYFVDGYHGGVYGHYPAQYTAFINEMLQKHPNWRINLEIEPETWDSVSAKEPENFRKFQEWMSDQSVQGRLEYVNPAYGQPYFYNISGESIIRQFQLGIQKLKHYFPGIQFSSYSSEEPCFTSALPQILKSFGIQYASLKNPNTCWGGYTRNYGGEMIFWEGPDGTKIPTVSRYQVEALDPNSTWQTTASTNSPAYLKAALNAGIKHPVGMCLQDAGWKNGPWLKTDQQLYPTEFTTWRNYFSNISTSRELDSWRFTQEDVQVSLVWGAQVLQQIARQCRFTENKLASAGKLAALASVYTDNPFPQPKLQEAWRQLLLAQHHDCWIVPYNGRRNNTWIDKVQRWTDSANRIADRVENEALHYLSATPSSAKDPEQLIVFNPNADDWTGLVRVPIPEGTQADQWVPVDAKNRYLPAQGAVSEPAILIQMTVPGTGVRQISLRTADAKSVKSGSMLAGKSEDGTIWVETDFYKIKIDPTRGGAITSLVAKKLSNKEFVNRRDFAGLNVLRGYFFNDGVYYSSADQPAVVSILENGPHFVKIKVEGSIQKHPFTQTIQVKKAEPLIDIALEINWQGNPGIGDDYKQAGGYRGEDYRKAFYDDRKKLQTLFPLNLDNQLVFKDAPFDVTESRLSDTYFRTWDSIKNNVLLNWVDITDREKKFGLALFTDHTTAYAHAPGEPLGLITQYSGVGLWGRNYSLNGPTRLRYALLPHAGNWQQAGIWQAGVQWSNPPTVAVVGSNGSEKLEPRLMQIQQSGFEITAIDREGSDLILRLFNPSTEARTADLSFFGKFSQAQLEEMDGRVIKSLPVRKKGSQYKLSVPFRRFGINSIRLKDFTR